MVFVRSVPTMVEAIDMVRDGMLARLPLLGLLIGLTGDSVVVLAVLTAGEGRSPA